MTGKGIAAMAAYTQTAEFYSDGCTNDEINHTADARERQRLSIRVMTILLEYIHHHNNISYSIQHLSYIS